MLSTCADQVVGVDISAEALEYAGRYRCPGRTEFVWADVERMPFSDATFDYVVSFETIEHVKEPGRLLTELRRILKPGGAVIISAPTDPEEHLSNRYHLHSFTPESLSLLVGTFFERVTTFAQLHVPLTRVHPMNLVRFLARTSGHWTRFLAPRASEYPIVPYRNGEARLIESVVMIASGPRILIAPEKVRHVAV